MGSERTATLLSSDLPLISGGRKRFTSSLLGIYAASIIRHRLMLEVLFDHIILDRLLTSLELLAKLLEFRLFVLLERSYTENLAISVILKICGKSDTQIKVCDF